MGRYEEITKTQTREIARKQKALDVALRELDIECSAYKPTSKRLVSDKGGDKKEGKTPTNDEGEKQPAKRPGPPDGHPGTTDERPVTHQVWAKFPACKGCGCRWIKITDMPEEFLTEIAKIIYQKTRMIHLEGNCVGCNRTIKGELELDDVREVEPSGGTGDVVPFGACPTTGQSGDDTDGKTPVSGGGREVGAGNVLVPVVRDEVAPAENMAEAADMDETESPATFEDAATGHADEDADGKTPMRSGGNADETGMGLMNQKNTGEHVKHDEDTTVGDIVEAADMDRENIEMPEEGTLGFNILYRILLQWRHRVTVRGVVDILIRLYQLGLSTATVWCSLRRMVVGLKSEYDHILDVIHNKDSALKSARIPLSEC